MCRCFENFVPRFLLHLRSPAAVFPFSDELMYLCTELEWFCLYDMRNCKLDFSDCGIC